MYDAWGLFGKSQLVWGKQLEGSFWKIILKLLLKKKISNFDYYCFLELFLPFLVTWKFEDIFLFYWTCIKLTALLPCEQPRSDSPWRSYQQIFLSPCTVRRTQPSILPRSVNEYRITLGHLRWRLLHRPPLVVWPTAKYLRSRVGRLHPSWLVQRNLGPGCAQFLEFFVS